MQVIGCQHDIVWEDKPANHARVKELLQTVSVQPGALVVLPEMFATGFSMNVERIAEGPDGPTHRFLAETAREHQAYVVGGVVSRDADGRGRNEAVVFGPDGREVARYCKLHPFSFGGETAHYAAGQETVVFDCGPFAIAPFVCYDLRFPEVFRRATRRGAQLLVVIAEWPQERDAHWLALLKARAIENQAYVVGVNRTGRDAKLSYIGHSQIIDPRGEILAAAGEGEEIIQAEVALEPLVEYRRRFPALEDMRAEYFP
jgi:predicted amidohydrolase